MKMMNELKGKEVDDNNNRIVNEKENTNKEDDEVIIKHITNNDSTTSTSTSTTTTTTTNNNNNKYDVDFLTTTQYPNDRCKYTDIIRYHHIIVIVLGDLGRSPRMQYHVSSLLQQEQQEQHNPIIPNDDSGGTIIKQRYHVTFIGYHGEDLIPFLQNYNNHNNDSQLCVIRFTPYNIASSIIPSYIKIPQFLYFIIRIISLSISLLKILIFDVLYKTPNIMKYKKEFKTCNNEERNHNKRMFHHSHYSWYNHVDCILIQNPPALPLMIIVLLYCRIIIPFCNMISYIYHHTMLIQYNNDSNNNNYYYYYRPVWIIDWHNFGYSMLRNGSIFQKIAKIYEIYISPYADGHYTVTSAMKEYIINNIFNNNKNNNNNNNNISVLYDCPPDIFQPLSIQQQHDEVWMKFNNEICNICPKTWNYNINNNNNNSENDIIQRTIFTEYNKNKNIYQSCYNRPALIMSSTSWTDDEDFSILLNALIQLDQMIIDNNKKNQNNNNEQREWKIIVIVTGKGPMKEYYMNEISKLILHHIIIHTMWLMPYDYPKLISCCDIGISLHSSTSTYDLPMKILDYYGCCVPILAYGYETLQNELVPNHPKYLYGQTFISSHELCIQLHTLLKPLFMINNNTPTTTISYNNHDYGELQIYTKNLYERQKTLRWNEHWKQYALPVINKALYNNNDKTKRNKIYD